MSTSTSRNPLNEHSRRRIAAEDLAAAETIDANTTADRELLQRKRVRKPFGAMEQKLQWPDRAGYHRHWFNDEPGRLLRAEEAGYEQVNDDAGKPVSCVVGISRGGGPLTAYLREIPEEWYREDMAAQEAVVLDLRRQIEQGDYERPQGVDGRLRYAGSQRGDISIRESMRR